MPEIRLSNLNLNLLPALDAVLQECHVTRAAARIGVSQSAMSYTLRQLRDLFDDELLVRGPQGMVRTARGDELAPKVRAALAELERALAPSAFDPRTASRGFTIATADSTFYTTILPLQRRLAEAAPHVPLRLSLLGLRPYEERLEDGELDLAIGMFFADHPGIRRQRLYTQGYATAVRQGHPAGPEPLTVEAYAAADHLIVTRKPTAERTTVDRLLDERGMARRIAMQVPSFPLALAAARTTDLVLSAPARFLGRPEAAHGLWVQPHPLVTREYPVSLVWHERAHRDPANRWLREQVRRAVMGGGDDATP